MSPRFTGALLALGAAVPLAFAGGNPQSGRPSVLPPIDAQSRGDKEPTFEPEAPVSPVLPTGGSGAFIREIFQASRTDRMGHIVWPDTLQDGADPSTRRDAISAIGAEECFAAPGLPGSVFGGGLNDYGMDCEGLASAFGSPLVNGGNYSFFATYVDSGMCDPLSYDEAGNEPVGLWVVRDGVASLVAHEGGPAPDANGNLIPGFTFVEFEASDDRVPTFGRYEESRVGPDLSHALNTNGRIAFYARIGDGSGVNSQLGGIWYTDESGDLRLLAKEGDFIPGSDSNVFEDLGLPIINDQNKIAFYAGHDAPSAPPESGLFFFDGLGNLTQVVAHGDIAPAAEVEDVASTLEIPGAEMAFTDFGEVPAASTAGYEISSRRPALNCTGDIVFTAILVDAPVLSSSAESRTLWKLTDGGLELLAFGVFPCGGTELARAGDPTEKFLICAGDGLPVFGQPVMNSGGDVAVVASALDLDVNSLVRAIVLFKSGDDPAVLAKAGSPNVGMGDPEGDTDPGVPACFISFAWCAERDDICVSGRFGSVSINDLGQVAFLARYRCFDFPDGFNVWSYGLYVANPGGEWFRIAHRGGLYDLDGSGGVFLRLRQVFAGVGGSLQNGDGVFDVTDAGDAGRLVFTLYGFDPILEDCFGAIAPFNVYEAIIPCPECDEPVDCTPCPWDLTGDGVVNAADQAELLGSWGPCPPAPADCPADFNDDGVVNAFDLGILLGALGPCPE